MNNSQFRRLVLDTPTTANQKSTVGATPRRDGATPITLGSRMRSSIPMTPRSVAGSSGVDFARQLREHNASLDPTTRKKFRSSAAPKGTKLASGYQDRTQLRTTAEEDDKAARVNALEEMVKLGQMDYATFEALRDEIVGGDVRDVHLVKGLDWKLLERVRKGEDVLGGPEKAEPKENGDGATKEEDTVDVDGALDELEEKEIKPLAKEEKLKKGEMAPPPSLAGKKRNRDDILRELKAARLAKAEEEMKAQQPSLGPKFRKLGQKQEKSRIERDEKGREILITVDEDGRVKRKIKKPKVEEDVANTHGLLMPDKDVKPLGMDITAIKAPIIAEDDDNGDIFEDAGADYDPLGGLDDEDDDETSEDDGELGKTAANGAVDDEAVDISPISSPDKSSSSMPPPPPNKPSSATRNYFGGPTQEVDSTSATKIDPLTDPTILAALKKASTINPVSSASSDAANEEEAAKLARRKRMLESHDRDADDMDLGFGSSRFEDGEDGEDRKVKLSVWGGDGGGEDGKGEGKGNRKRGAKKRKGDVNSAADVLKVIERRKGEGK